jgi:hypothetical protein
MPDIGKNIGEGLRPIPLPTDGQVNLEQINMNSLEETNQQFSFGISNIITFISLVLMFSIIFIIVAMYQTKKVEHIPTLRELEEEHINHYKLITN